MRTVICWLILFGLAPAKPAPPVTQGIQQLAVYDKELRALYETRLVADTAMGCGGLTQALLLHHLDTLERSKKAMDAALLRQPTAVQDPETVQYMAGLRQSFPLLVAYVKSVDSTYGSRWAVLRAESENLSRQAREWSDKMNPLPSSAEKDEMYSQYQRCSSESSKKMRQFEKEVGEAVEELGNKQFFRPLKEVLEYTH